MGLNLRAKVGGSLRSAQMSPFAASPFRTAITDPSIAGSPSSSTPDTPTQRIRHPPLQAPRPAPPPCPWCRRFSYLIINKRHAAERCPHMFEVMEFWSWFLHAPPLDHVFARHHISALPTVVADAVWAHLTNDVHCGDHPVWSLPQQREVQGSGDQSVAAAFGDLGAIFSSRHSNLAVTYTVGSPDLARSQLRPAPCPCGACPLPNPFPISTHLPPPLSPLR